MARISKPPEVRRQEILDTAMELFAEKGYEDTSMADIARRMGGVQGLSSMFGSAVPPGCPSSTTGAARSGSGWTTWRR